MRYADARKLIKDGDLIALTHKRWDSLYDLQVQAVRVFTQSEYCHVGTALHAWDRLFLIESVAPFVRIWPLSNLSDDGFFWVNLDTPMSYAELRFAMSKVGKGRYSKWQAIMAKFRQLAIGADDLWECAEFMITHRRLSGLDLGDVATPDEVVEVALRRPGAALTWVEAPASADR